MSWLYDWICAWDNLTRTGGTWFLSRTGSSTMQSLPLFNSNQESKKDRANADNPDSSQMSRCDFPPSSLPPFHLSSFPPNKYSLKKLFICLFWVLLQNTGSFIVVWELSNSVIDMSDLSCSTRDQTHVPCIARWILNNWTTRNVPQQILLNHYYV